MSVPRETETAPLEREPEIAAQLFGDRLPVARQYVEALASRGEILGLMGPLELPRLWTRHVINCALLAPLVDGDVADVGSGAGLPGIVLAIARPDVVFTLIEPMERRVEWLSEQCDQLRLSNVTVERARAEEAPRGRFDVVTARAVGALAKLLPLTAPLVKPGGSLVLMKGASVDAEVTNARKAIARLGLSETRVEVLGDGLPTEATRVFRAKVG